MSERQDEAGSRPRTSTAEQPAPIGTGNRKSNDGAQMHSGRRGNNGNDKAARDIVSAPARRAGEYSANGLSDTPSVPDTAGAVSPVQPAALPPSTSGEKAQPAGASRQEPTTRPEGSAAALHATPRSASRSNVFDRWLARRLQSAVGPQVCVALWDGWQTGNSADAELVVRFRSRGALWALLRDRSIGFGEGYASGRIEVRATGASVPTIVPDACQRNGLFVPSTQALIRLCELASAAGLRREVGPARPLRRFRRNSLERSRHNVYHHYDIGNDFYRLWLDENLVYTCAYYHDWDNATLEQAQLAKMDLVCRKVRLRPGQEVIEAGCGWGGLALHMARHYGVRVRAFNVSREQLAYARQRALREGLADRVEFIERDWREIDGECDAFVSVGMLEHVGPENYAELGRVIRRVLRPDGLAILHSIGRDRPARLDRWIDRRIFPGAHPPSLREMAAIFESGGFSVLDVENLRLHYARTLEDWLLRFERHEQAVREMYDEQFVRTWRLYLCGSIAAFRTGVLQLFQVVFTHRDNHAPPLNRAHILDGFSLRPATAAH